MRLPDRVYTEVEDANISVQFADGKLVAIWNELERTNGEGRRIWHAGWYWFPAVASRSPYGPFRSMSAAYRDAHKHLPEQAPSPQKGDSVERKPRRVSPLRAGPTPPSRGRVKLRKG